MDVGNEMYWAPNHSQQALDSDQKQFLFSGIFVSTPKAEAFSLKQKKLFIRHSLMIFNVQWLVRNVNKLNHVIKISTH